MSSNTYGLTNRDIDRLAALRDEVQAGGRSEGDVSDSRQTRWLAFWQHEAARGADVFAAVDRRAEWTCGWAGDVEFGTHTDPRTGIEYVRATLRECVTAFGLTRCQAVNNLDQGVRNYIARLETRPTGPHGQYQLMRMHRYLTARGACPCGDTDTPCPCETDEPERIAH